MNTTLQCNELMLTEMSKAAINGQSFQLTARDRTHVTSAKRHRDWFYLLERNAGLPRGPYHQVHHLEAQRMIERE